MASQDPTTKNKLRNWLADVCQEDGVWIIKAISLVLKSGVPTQLMDLRAFIIKEGLKPDDLVDQIMGEAEFVCEQQGGGTAQFLIRAHRDGERLIHATRPFSVTLEQTEASEQADATAQGVLAMVLKHNERLQTTNLQMASALSSGLPRIMEAQADMVRDMQRVSIDNFSLMRANIEDRDRREAETAITIQRAKDWGELKAMLVPALFEHFAPIVAQFLQNMTPQAQPPAVPSAAEPTESTRATITVLPHDDIANHKN